MRGPPASAQPCNKVGRESLRCQSASNLKPGGFKGPLHAEAGDCPRRGGERRPGAVRHGRSGSSKAVGRNDGKMGMLTPD